MNDAPLSPTPADALRRKQTALILAGGCCALLVLAFMLGGKKAPVVKDIEKDVDLGIVDKSLAYEIGGSNTPNDWLNGTEDNGSDSGASNAAAPGKQEPAVVAGNEPAASMQQIHAGEKASAPPTPEKTVVAGNEPAASMPQIHAGEKASAPPAPVKTVVADSGVPAPPASGSAAAALPKQETAALPAVTPPQTAVLQADSAATHSAAPGATHAPKDSSGTVAAAKTTPQKAAEHAKAQRSGASVFVKPKGKRAGVLAQSHALITQENMADAGQSAHSSTKAQNPKSKSAPAAVPQMEARKYAERTTENFRQQGALTATQRVRLPRSTETTNKKVWREDDKPATPDERRPFGLVVVDEKAAAPAAATPEGIPLRTDIPAGTSSLEKTGADKPLWKRPE